MALRGGPVRSSASAGTVPGWRTEDFHRFLTHFLEEGVVQGVGSALAVSERGAGANMSVDVAAGLCLINITTTLLSPNETINTWLYNSDVLNVAVPTADGTNPRKDRIIAKFDMTVDPNGTASNNVSIELVEGTPAGSPSAPAEPSNAITLAIIDVPASDTTIGNAQITDSRTYVTLDTGVLADVTRTSETNAILENTPFYNTSTGSTNAYALATTPARAAYIAGQRFSFKANFTNTGAATLNVDGLGVKTIKKNDGATDLIANDIISGQIVKVEYDGTNFQMLSPGGTPVSITHFVKPVFLGYTTSSAAGTSSTSQAVFDTNNYTIPADDLVAGVGYRFTFGGTITWAAGNVNLYIKLGSTDLLDVGDTLGATADWRVEGEILGTTTSGPAAAVRGSAFFSTGNEAINRADYASVNFATNGTLLLQAAIKFDSSNGGNDARCTFARIEKFSTTAF